MLRKSLPYLLLLPAVLVLFGCPPPRQPDVNPHLFESATQASTRRHAILISAWQDMALSILRVDRPDIPAVKAAPFAIELRADGATQTVDLSGLEPLLKGTESQQRDIMRKHLIAQLPAFDQQRLAVMGFAGARKLLIPLLITQHDLAALGQSAGGAIRGNPVLGELVWIVVARWPESDASAPLTNPLVARWNVKPADIDKAALDNLRPQLTEKAIMTQTFGNSGRAGNLTPNADAAVIILPEFLATVRTAWQTGDDLVVLVGGQRDVRFAERSNQRVLKILLPTWQTRLGAAQNPLLSRLVLLSDKGIDTYIPPTTTAPASAPTRPATRPYITLPG